MRGEILPRRVAVPLQVSQRSATPRAGASLHVLNGQTMGTRWSIKLAAAPGAPLDDLRSAVERSLDGIIAEMSTFEPDSDISRFNRAPAGTWHRLPEDFFFVLDYAIKVARDSDGAYDPTVGRLVGLWGFGASGAQHRVPCEDEIADARARCGWSSVVLDGAQRSARQPGRLQLDLSSVAKGFAVDRLADTVAGAGFSDFLVEIGGELRGHGVKPDGLPWWVALERAPAPTDGIGTVSDIVIALNGLAVATSGSAEHFFEAHGQRYAHTIDPRSGKPVAHDLGSVSVLHAKCMHADALATALMVLGPEDGMAHAMRLGLAARFVSAGPEGVRERLTPRFAAMLA